MKTNTEDAMITKGKKPNRNFSIVSAFATQILYPRTLFINIC